MKTIAVLMIPRIETECDNVAVCVTVYMAAEHIQDGVLTIERGKVAAQLVDPESVTRLPNVSNGAAGFSMVRGDSGARP